MADEEQPFLGFDPGTGRKRFRGPQGIRGWLVDYLFPKPSVSRIVLMSLAILAVIAISIASIVVVRSRETILQSPRSCDTIDEGYECEPQTSHFWGQYSPYFKVSSVIFPDVPAGCEITFAQVLARHGARDPTLGKSILYAKTIQKLKDRVRDFSGKYTFLANYSYNLGADQLTSFGEQAMINSGNDFFSQYAGLANSSIPFIRASGQQRVVQSAQRWGQGFYQAKVAAGGSKDTHYPYDVLAISEETGSNNTLDHGLCTAFESSNTGSIAQEAFTSTFIPAITTRLHTGLPNANLTNLDTIFLMDLCPFETVAHPLGKPSQFCALFTQDEWKQYDYYQTLGKYYGFGPGNALGPTQGVGFANELIARLTGRPVVDQTTSNSTLDTNPTTFPLGRSLYADFGHDNDMTSAFAALGLYNSTPTLAPTDLMTIEETKGYSAAWTVPFAARAIFEKMHCGGAEEEMVRVLVNGRVLPLEMCGGDAFGRCALSKFVGSLSFAQGGGYWDQCFAEAEGSVPGHVEPSGAGEDVEEA